MSEDEIERVQRFESEDEQRAAALRFAREVVESRGHPSDESLEEAREAGYTDEQIDEMRTNKLIAEGDQWDPDMYNMLKYMNAKK